MKKNLRKKIAQTFVVSLICFSFVYAIFRTSPLIFGATLSYSVEKISDNHFVIKGIAKKSKSVFVNGQNVPMSEDGVFAVDFVPSAGLTIVDVTTKNKFGSAKTITTPLYYESNTALARGWQSAQ